MHAAFAWQALGSGKFVTIIRGMITLSKNPEPDYLDMLLQPNTSLAPERFLLVMCLVVFASTVGSVVLFMVGAWPAVAFLGVDVLLLYLAFRVYFNAAKNYERLRVERDGLHLLNKHGVVKSWEPSFLQVIVEEEKPTALPRLLVASRGEQYEIGRFLGLEEKHQVQTHLITALRTRIAQLPHA